MKHLKEEFDKLTFKDVFVFVIAAITIAAGFVLLFMGLLIPPRGEIHDSVLMAFGLILVFVGSMLGFSMNINSKLSTLKAMIPGMITDAINSKETGKGVNADG